MVDDETSVVSLLREALENEGYGIETATSGAEAIRKIESLPLDAIISDLKMPGKGGKDVYLYCVENKPILANRFLLLTGDVVGQEAYRFTEKYNVLYVSKPFDLKEFLSSVKFLFQHGHENNEESTMH